LHHSQSLTQILLLYSATHRSDTVLDSLIRMKTSTTQIWATVWIIPKILVPTRVPMSPIMKNWPNFMVSCRDGDGCEDKMTLLLLLFLLPHVPPLCRRFQNRSNNARRKLSPIWSFMPTATFTTSMMVMAGECCIRLNTGKNTCWT
jgi:hypothetical protein